MIPTEPYRVELITEPCPTCDRGAAFGVVYDPEHDLSQGCPPTTIATFLHVEAAQGERDRLNAAYLQGLQIGKMLGAKDMADATQLNVTENNQFPAELARALNNWAAGFARGNGH